MPTISPDTPPHHDESNDAVDNQQHSQVDDGFVDRKPLTGSGRSINPSSGPGDRGASPSPMSQVTECAGCGTYIQDKYYLAATDKQSSRSTGPKWHEHCLKCSSCNCPLDPGLKCYVAKDGHIYCKEDYYRIFPVRSCTRCGQGIYYNDFVMKVRDHAYHMPCFSCVWCHQSLAPGDYFGLRDGGLIYCKTHLEMLNSPPNGPGNNSSIPSPHHTMYGHPFPPHLNHHPHPPPPFGAQYHQRLSQQTSDSPPPPSLGGPMTDGDMPPSMSPSYTSLFGPGHHHQLGLIGGNADIGRSGSSPITGAAAGASGQTGSPDGSSGAGNGGRGARKGRPRKRKGPANPANQQQECRPGSGAPLGDSNDCRNGDSSLGATAGAIGSALNMTIDPMTGQPVNGASQQAGQIPQNSVTMISNSSSNGPQSMSGSPGSSPHFGHHHLSSSQQAGRTKRMRTSFKHHQLRTMKSYFNINQNPDAKDLKQLAQKTGLSKRVLQVWFQNARAKWRRNNLRGIPGNDPIAAAAQVGLNLNDICSGGSNTPLGLSGSGSMCLNPETPSTGIGSPGSSSMTRQFSTPSPNSTTNGLPNRSHLGGGGGTTNLSISDQPSSTPSVMMTPPSSGSLSSSAMTLGGGCGTGPNGPVCPPPIDFSPGDASSSPNHPLAHLPPHQQQQLHHHLMALQQQHQQQGHLSGRQLITHLPHHPHDSHHSLLMNHPSMGGLPPGGRPSCASPATNASSSNSHTKNDSSLGIPSLSSTFQELY